MAVINSPVVASLWELASIHKKKKASCPGFVQLMTMGSPKEGDGD